MIKRLDDEARELVNAVRDAAQVHKSSWEALVPNSFVVNLDAESAEEDAYSEMARRKDALRRHICRTYGISIRELCSLSTP